MLNSRDNSPPGGKLMRLLMGLLVVMALAWVTRGLLTSRGPRIMPTSTLITQVQSLNELVMVKYLVEKVVKLESEDSVLGRDRIILLAHGVVKAGVDLTRMGPSDIQVHGDRVVMTLPPPRITDCYLDERKTEVWEHKTAFWRPLDTELEQNARRQALDQIRLQVGQQGIQKEAMERARTQLYLLLKALGFQDVEIRQS